MHYCIAVDTKAPGNTHSYSDSEYSQNLFVLTTAKLHLLIDESLQDPISGYESKDESDADALQNAIWHFETKKSGKIISSLMQLKRQLSVK